MKEIVGLIVGNTQSGPHLFRKKKPHGWQYSDGLVAQSYHDAEIDRLRAELQNAAKAALDATALACEKEREADALRVDAERYRWLCEDHSDALMRQRRNLLLEYFRVRSYSENSTAIDAAMGEGK